MNRKFIMSRPKINPDTVVKICKFCNNKFDVSFYKRNITKYCNKKCANADPEVKNKIIESQTKTYNKNYNGLHPMKTQSVKNNFVKSMMQTHHVSHPSKIVGFSEKVKKTKFKKYGIENYNNCEQYKKTCLTRYGVDNVLKNKTITNKVVVYSRKKHYKFIVEFCKSRNITTLFNESQYIGYAFKNKYRFKCNTCNSEFETDVYKPRHIFCEHCNPSDNDTLETDLFKYITSILPLDTLVKRNDRTVLNGKELDVYVPDKKIAIELNGLYWHSENGRGIGKLYHLNKTKSCICKEIKLIHIFENEWVAKKEIVKSILKNLIGRTDKKLYGRSCIVKPISGDIKNNFLNENHLQGCDKSSIKYGLYHNDELVSVMTFVKSRFDKKIQYEMYRYCNKIGTHVTGGASKLFKYFIKHHSPTSIVSYNDKRYFDGVVYQRLGFVFTNNTVPNYWYIKSDYKSLYNRMSFQKHKLNKLLINFDPNLTEWENMKSNNYDRIWDCGNGKWVWNKP